MSGLQPITSTEMDRLFAMMPGEAATRIISFADALAVFAAAADKRKAAAAMAARLAPIGYKGLSYKSLMRKLDAFRRKRYWSLVPAKYKRDEMRGIAANGAFVAHWHELTLANRRKMRPAWAQLIREFAAGVAVPGVGTWRELYLRERGYMPGEGEPCPWSERNPPPGWSFRNLVKFAPDEFAIEAAHHGMVAAKSRFGLTVSKTRVGLACCRIVEVDDMWYENKVIYPGNTEPQRVVEFAAMDKLTAHVIWRIAKPIRERADGTRETLKAAWAKYIYHAVLCLSGIPDEGCIIRGERGTTRSDAEFDEALRLVNVWRKGQGLGEVAFEAGSLANAPVGKGLHNGAAKGNPRHKGMIEQMHATLKNELGSVLGEVGGGRGVEPEEAGAMVAEARSLMAIAGAAGVSVERMATPFLSWTAFAEAAERAHDNIDRRTVHQIEGWERCGFMAGEFRLKEEAGWRSVPPIGEMKPETAGAVTALVNMGRAEYRERRLSPHEAWEKSKGVLKRVPDYLAPKILGSELCVVARVKPNMQFVYRDPNIGERLTIAAVAGERMLTRGAEYRIWVNPLDGDRAYVCDMQGLYLGVAKVLQAVRADATAEDLAEQLGLRQRVLSDEMRRLAPIVRRRQREAAARAAQNIAALGIREEIAEDNSAADAVATKAASVDVRDLFGDDARDCGVDIFG